MYNTQVNNENHCDGDSMFLLLDGRESGLGGIPMSEKKQKITPEWQTERNTPVGSAVARVKGEHFDMR